MYIIALFVAAAVLPALFLMRYIYRKDAVERESYGMLIKLVVFGGIAGLIAGVLNSVGEFALSNLVEKDSLFYHIALAFLVVGVVEEGLKFLFLKMGTWNSYEFNYRFDGIVYAAFVSLGFAALENVTYVFTYGLSVALPRALLSVPAHLGFSVFMGSYYGRAKLCAAHGDSAGSRGNLLHAYLTAVFLHGFYDACAMAGTGVAMLLFWVFVALMYIVVIRRVRREAANDQAIRSGMPGDFPTIF